MDLIMLFISAALINNFVLIYFLGICPFLGVSNKIDKSLSMGIATTFVMVLAALATWLINNLILIPFNVTFLQYVAFIIVIASLVQLVEMFIKKTSPVLYRALGIFLPLITTNCAVLGLALFASLRNYNCPQAVVFGFASGVGFTLALIIMAGIREFLDEAPIPEPFKGAPIALIIAGLLALSFMGFGGLLSS